MIRFFNTLSGKKESLPKNRPINFFVCGPTVYDYSHIGHARTYIAFDNLARYLKSQKIKVFYLQNITDIDDKIIERAKLQKISPAKLAEKYEKEYYRDMESLGIASVNRYAKASKFIKEIKKQISNLIKNGFAYQTSSGVYFEIKKFKDYGKLSKQNLEALRPGYRIEQDPEKKDPLDFALWKLKKSGAEPSWLSPWGEGRPGWHIEDTAISEKFFGAQYDLHGGAADLKFPHHESEIAQQEASSGKKPFVKIWLHTGFLLVNGEKMSKSLGNFIAIRDFLKTSSPEILRYIVFSHHYRSPIDYTSQTSAQAGNSLKKLRHFLLKLQLARKQGAESKNIKGIIKKFNSEFKTSMEDDFNTPDALAAIFSLINKVEMKIWSLTASEARQIKNTVTDALQTFGINLKKTEKNPLKIAELLEKRELCRAHKQFTQSDALRKEIEALGFIIEDTPLGPLVFKSD